jgi:hypothetical protein
MDLLVSLDKLSMLVQELLVIEVGAAAQLYLQHSKCSGELAATPEQKQLHGLMQHSIPVTA